MRRIFVTLFILATLTGCAGWNWKATGEAWRNSLCRDQHKQSCNAGDED